MPLSQQKKTEYFQEICLCKEVVFKNKQEMDETVAFLFFIQKRDCSLSVSRINGKFKVKLIV